MGCRRRGRSPRTSTAPRSVRAHSYSDRRLDRRVWVIVLDHDVVVGVVEDRVTRCKNEFRVRTLGASELFGDLLDMVGVYVPVAAGPDEVTDTQARLRGHHVRQQRIARDVERHTEEQVGAALI